MVQLSILPEHKQNLLLKYCEKFKLKLQKETGKCLVSGVLAIDAARKVLWVNTLVGRGVRGSGAPRVAARMCPPASQSEALPDEARPAFLPREF